MAHFIGQGPCPHEVPKVVSESEQLKSHLVILEPLAGEPCPLNRILPFFDPLLGSAAFVVEVNHSGRVPPEICDDEPHPGEEFSSVPLHLGDDAAGLRPALRLVAETRVEDLGL